MRLGSSSGTEGERKNSRKTPEQVHNTLLGGFTLISVPVKSRINITDRLILIKQSLTWWEALHYCRNHHHDLVSVRTEEMQLWVKEATRNASTEHVWLGLRHNCIQRIWFWVFRTMLCYEDWAPGKGMWNEDCKHEKRSGTVQSGGGQQWVDLPENNKLNFICATYDEIPGLHEI